MPVILIVAIAAIILLLLVLRSTNSQTKPEAYYDLSEEERHRHKWGYVDTRFEFDDPRNVKVTGNRYPISGFRMPHLMPFVEEMLNFSICPEDMAVENQDHNIPQPNIKAHFLKAIETQFKPDQSSMDEKDRLVHSHGQLSVDEIYRILYGSSLERVVDLVFFPQSEEDIKGVIELANEHNVCLIPYGGGTNVSGALAIPAEEERMVVSVDMQRMNRLIWIDEENFQACIEAGIMGKHLEKLLNEKGYTSGHDPDSIEFSTLGGWISTNASGMKKNKYGNIEDIVIEATLVTPTGDIKTKCITPRNSTGIQPQAFLFGSEGNLGIITKAVIKIHLKPEARKFGSLVFPRFENGIRFLKELRQSGTLPASIRLVNNNEFRFGQALKPKPTFWKGIISYFQKFILLQVKGFQPLEMVACTVLMEGAEEEVNQQEKALFRIAKRHQGISGGASNGKWGYSLTFGIAYIRDFFGQFHILGETFETSVPWSKVLQVCQSVQQELVEQAETYQVPGTPYLSYRVTQTYHTGVCIYFTMAFYGKGLEDPDKAYHHIEQRLRQVILDNGGSLSHHHGIGKIRQGFLPQVHTENSFQMLRQSKKTVDPNNVFGIGNGVFYESSKTG
ncbi:TPA: FAD-binding oxidoreductase [Candidatus Poribacteria bacterium]|nr:FAD-binding oxidoreductase [Candidatus Poribacteria bacterium]HIA64689.1 FAD-binding oxidoreductase [Candidatus Poribacteria bacterium]HIC03159.1 FAD-binding oxidoreductase [Candidatus Poribacteria bacterium]HIM11746.1 FAD-binding oxidoreductase [Candidatus Poribacteria bacterium]HIN31231.1 FAD-binding oxidoreductase [Candidatus Poribacteria bacterium]